MLIYFTIFWNGSFEDRFSVELNEGMYNVGWELGSPIQWCQLDDNHNLFDNASGFLD